jgi:hypothetical protein
MTEFTETEKQEITKIINEIYITVHETRHKCTDPAQLELLNEIEKKLIAAFGKKE